MQLAAAAVVPHAPLLLPEVAGLDVAPEVTVAARGVDVSGADVIVVVSPHGSATGVYAGASGNLDAFGPLGIGIDAAPAPAAARALAGRWDRPLLDEPVDHGVVVPLRLLDAGETPVVAVAFQEGIDADVAIEEAGRLAGALGAGDGTFTLLASANTSAGLTERAPLPSLPSAAAADAAVLEALRDDAKGVLAGLPDLALAGSCAAGPLAVHALLCGGRASTLLAYEHPFGVGYAVSVTS